MRYRCAIGQHGYWLLGACFRLVIVIPFFWWERVESNYLGASQPPIYSRVPSPFGHTPKTKKPPRISPWWLRCRYFVSFYGEATLVSGSFARAWRLEYLTCSGLAQVPSTGAKIPLSHELALMLWAFSVCVMCLEEVIV